MPMTPFMPARLASTASARAALFSISSAVFRPAARHLFTKPSLKASRGVTASSSNFDDSVDSLGQLGPLCFGPGLGHQVGVVGDGRQEGALGGLLGAEGVRGG